MADLQPQLTDFRSGAANSHVEDRGGEGPKLRKSLDPLPSLDVRIEFGDPPIMDGERAPYVPVVQEPWMRLAAMLLARGEVDVKGIAQSLGRKRHEIDQLLGQPWFQEAITQELNSIGCHDVIPLLAAEQINCFNVLREIRDNPKVAPSVRAQVAQDMWNRILGKPLIRVESKTQNVPCTTMEEAERIAREVANLHEQNFPTPKIIEINPTLKHA